MSAQQIDRVGEYMTIREAARIKGATPNALYLWRKSRQVPCSKVGRTIVVRLVDVVGYTPRGK